MIRSYLFMGRVTRVCRWNSFVSEVISIHIIRICQRSNLINFSNQTQNTWLQYNWHNRSTWGAPKLLLLTNNISKKKWIWTHKSEVNILKQIILLKEEDPWTKEIWHFCVLKKNSSMKLVTLLTFLGVAGFTFGKCTRNSFDQCNM